MSEKDYKYQKFLYSNSNPHILLPRLTMHEFFGAVGFSPDNYIFDLQFWLDLNKLDDNTMFIVDDEIIAAFGYKESKSNASSFRSNFFRMIKTHFRKDLDYRTSNQQRLEPGRMGNPNVTQLEMTKNAFKFACLLSKTEKSTQIYQFLLDLEKHVTAFMKYENEYLNELASTTKTTMMTIEQDQNTNDDIDLSSYPDLPVDSYDNTIVIYLFYLRRYQALKFGISTELHNRAQRHYRAFGEKPGEVRLIHVIKTEHASSIENSIKHACIQNDWKRDDIIINGSVQTEIIDLKKTSIDAVIQLMNSFLQQHLCLKRKHEDEIIERNERHIVIEKERLCVEGKKIDFQIKKIESDIESKRIESKRIEAEIESKRMESKRIDAELQIKKMAFELEKQKLKCSAKKV